MPGKIQATVFLLCLMVAHPVSSQSIFEILNLLSGGGGRAGQKGEMIITTFHNINAGDNRDDKQHITMVQTDDSMDTDMEDTIFDDFDTGFSDWDATPDLSDNNRFDPGEKPAKAPQVDLINTSVVKMLSKLAKEPNTDAKLIEEIEDEMKTVTEKVRNIISIAMDSDDVCIGENSSTITKKDCKAACNENEITLPRVQRSIPDGHEMNKLNAIKSEKDFLSTIDELLFHIIADHPTEATQMKKVDATKKHGDEAGDKCTVEDNIKCTNSFLDEVVKCSHAASIAEDRLQLNVHEIIEVINKLFLHLTDVAFQNGSLSDRKISDKLNIIKSHLRDAIDGFIETIEPSSESETQFNNLGAMWEAVEKVTNPTHHIVGRKLPTRDIAFQFSKKKIPGKKYDFRQYDKPEANTIDKINNSNSENDGDIEDQLKSLFKQIVQSQSHATEHPRSIVSKTTPLLNLKLNLGKPESRDFTDIMYFIFSMMDGLNTLINTVDEEEKAVFHHGAQY